MNLEPPDPCDSPHVAGETQERRVRGAGKRSPGWWARGAAGQQATTRSQISGNRDVQNWTQLAAAATLLQRWLSQLVVFEYPLGGRVASPLIPNKSKRRRCHSVPCRLIISSAGELAVSNIDLA